MADLKMLDRAYQSIMQRFINTGRAPHYTELASELGLSVEDGRHLLQDLIDSGIPMWLDPGDNIVSFAPFNNLPTQYFISIDGRQSWFGQ